MSTLITYYLLFVNTVSGGGIGRSYLTLKNKKVKFKNTNGATTQIYLYDLLVQSDRKKGYKKAVELTRNDQVNVVICGGDGTILWVVSEIFQYHVDPNHVFFTVIPIGTGNDFSRSLNWGGSPIKFQEGNTDALKKRVKEWKMASRAKFDLWDIQIITEKNGKILSPKEDEAAEGVTVYKRTFSNYMGLGIDARVSYGFQKNRKRNKLINLAIYGCIGFCNLFSKTDKINDVVSELSQSESESQSEDITEELDTSMNSQRKNAFLLKEELKPSKKYHINRKARGLVCMNCTSYMAGVRNVWKGNKKKIQSEQYEQLEQKFDDGKLEFISFRNQLSLGLQRFINVCSKVGQGQGPFIIQFKKTERPRKMFIHIDGQAMVAYGLKQINIRRTSLINEGQINVLVKNL